MWLSIAASKSWVHLTKSWNDFRCRRHLAPPQWDGPLYLLPGRAAPPTLSKFLFAASTGHAKSTPSWWKNLVWRKWTRCKNDLCRGVAKFDFREEIVESM